MTETDLVILPCWPAATYLADKTAELALANKSVLKELARDPFGKSPPNSIEMFSKMTGMAAPAYLYSALRSEVRATIGSVFIDRPQIVAQHGVLTRVGPGELTAKAALDVIENGVGADPFGDDAFKLRMLQGVADTNAEAIALSGNGENVGEAFKLAGAAGTWTIFRREDRDKLKTSRSPTRSDGSTVERPRCGSRRCGPSTQCSGEGTRWMVACRSCHRHDSRDGQSRLGPRPSRVCVSTNYPGDDGPDRLHGLHGRRRGAGLGPQKARHRR